MDAIDTLNEAPMYTGETTSNKQGTREPRHIEVFDHMRKRLEEVIRALEALACEIAKEPAKDSVPESDTPMQALSLQEFIQNTAGESVDNFANEAMNQIARIKEMLF